MTMDVDKAKELSTTLAIDKDMLDDELVKHSELFWHACELLSKHTTDRDAIKAKIKAFEAQLDQKIRDEAASEGTKITEKEIERLIARNGQILSMQSTFLESASIVRHLEFLKEAFQERRHNLNRLVDLFTSNYWSSPRGSTAVKEQTASRARSDLAQRRRATTTQPKGEPRGQ